MASPPTTSFCVKLLLIISMVMLFPSSTFVHCRGLARLEDSCESCYREIGRAVWEIVSGESNTEEGTQDDISSESHSPNDGFMALLMDVEGRRPREDLECSACWIIAHRLKKQMGISKALAGDYGSFKKRAMLNNGWD